MSKTRLLSGKVKKVSGYKLDPLRSKFIDLSNAEPDLGIPLVVGEGGKATLLSTADGVRSWEPAQPANGVSTFTYTTGSVNAGQIGDLVIVTPANLVFTATVSLNTTTVKPGVYGTSTEIPIITVDEFGRITAITTSSLGAPALEYNTLTGQITIINQGGSTSSNITLDPFKDSDVEFRNLTLKGSLYGPTVFVIDPATTGTAAGLVIIRGDLQVEGTQTVIDSVTVEIGDKNIVLAKGSTTATQSDGAGLSVNLGNTLTSFYYDAALDSWYLDRPLIVPNLLAATASITATDITVDIFSNKEFLTTATLAQTDQFIVKDVSSGTVKITTLADFGIQAARAAFNFGPTPPLDPQPGDRWVDSLTLIELVYIDDGDSLQWIEISSAGPQGLTGFTGSQGPPDGYTGSRGRDGTSVTILGSVSSFSSLPGYPSSYMGVNGDGYLTNDNGHLWVWSGTTWIDAGEIRGPQGDQGPRGYLGSTGYIGSVGYSGSIGPIGYTGSQGEPGVAAFRGYTGSNITGFSGSRGLTGFVGSFGYSGSLGEIGYVGSIGYTGSSAPGYTGSLGIIGYTGSVGEVTLNGGQTLFNKTFNNVILLGSITETAANNTGTSLSATLGTMQYKTLSANTVFTDSVLNGQSLSILITNGDIYDITWPTITWVSQGGGSEPILSGTDWLTFWKVNNILYGAYIGSTLL